MQIYELNASVNMYSYLDLELTQTRSTRYPAYRDSNTQTHMHTQPPPFLKHANTHTHKRNLPSTHSLFYPSHARTQKETNTQTHAHTYTLLPYTNISTLSISTHINTHTQLQHINNNFRSRHKLISNESLRLHQNGNLGL